MIKKKTHVTGKIKTGLQIQFNNLSCLLQKHWYVLNFNYELSQRTARWIKCQSGLSEFVQQ